ncbi:hypothetical protein QQ045_022526 [Rhodiola kirilowii]
MENKYESNQIHKSQGDESLYDNREDNEEEIFTSTGCFHRLLCFKWWRNGDTDSQFLLNQREEGKKESWFELKLKRVKEASEVFAGPNWKNFIRKLGGYFNQGKCKKKKFQYDSHSYALNFDNMEQEEDQIFASFSARFAPPLNHNHRPSGF